jgi:hypothetical protein
MTKKIKYNDKKLNIIYDVDCCVIGGGAAGAPAAISAAMQGIKTLIIDKGVCLGGSQTKGLVTPVMPSRVDNYNTEINTIVLNKLKEFGDLNSDGIHDTGWFDPEKLSYAYEQLIIENSGEILYDADLVDIIKIESEIKYIVLNTIAGLVAVKSKTFIDSTGNACLSRLSGVLCEKGDKNGENQAVSFRFEMAGVDIDKLYNFMQSKGDTFCPTKPPFYEIAMVEGKDFVLESEFKQAVKEGYLLPEDLHYFQAFAIPSKPGVMSFNCPEIPDMTDASDPILCSKATTKGREMQRRIVEFVKHFIPGFENAFKIKESSMLNIRESYRIKGKYFMTEDDYFRRSKFDDAVAKSAYYIDVHGKNYLADYHMKPGEYYEIPYRALVTNEIDNLIVAGRCVSANFLMQSSLRVQRTCRDMGEAAGKACAISLKENTPLNELNWKKEFILE